jgi:hypothetical protein
VTVAAGSSAGSPGVLANGGTITAGPNATTPGTLNADLTLNGDSNIVAKVVSITGNSNTTATAGVDNDLIVDNGSTTTVTATQSAPLNVQLALPTASVINFNSASTYTFQILKFNGFSETGVSDFAFDPSGTTILATDGGAGAPALSTEPSDASGLFTLDTSAFANASLTSTSTGSFALELVSNNGGSGYLDVVYSGYTPAPEPGTAVLVLCGGLPMLMARRRRRQPRESRG